MSARNPRHTMFCICDLCALRTAIEHYRANVRVGRPNDGCACGACRRTKHLAAKMRRKCSDDGVCHHGCGDDCWRKHNCGALTPDGKWPKTNTEQALAYVRKFDWLTTAPNPILPGYAEPRGWKCHGVLINGDNGTRAACGMRASHGWSVDLFIEKKCARCLVALGVECKECHGTGAHGIRPCLACMSTGEHRAFREQQRAAKAERLAKTAVDAP
jgi:hypothetical protein